VLECVVNISEGARLDVVSSLTGAAGAVLWDVHSDAHHNRSVFTLGGSSDDAVLAGAQALASAAVALLDVRDHVGVHPRIGVVDVVPFVPLRAFSMEAAVGLRDRFAAWMGDEVGVPCFLYGPPGPSAPTLPEVRRGAFTHRRPDVGPPLPHASAGACAVGARDVLVAYNVWLADGVGVEAARSAAAAVRSADVVRALGLDVGGRAQVSCNLLAPEMVGPAEVFDAVSRLAPVAGGELVGLVPESVLRAVPAARWADLGLSDQQTIESRW
jgi:glutamate formiminotransferase